jgi:hypothetical protein
MKIEESIPANINNQALLPAELNDLKSNIRHFFVNNPPEKSKNHLWELFKWWAKDNEAATRQDIIDMILYHDACQTVMEKVYTLFFCDKSKEGQK